MTKLYKALSIMLFLSCLFIIPAQAENIDLNQTIKKYFKAIEQEALKDRIILKYQFNESKNVLALTIHHKNDFKNFFGIIYEFSKLPETPITVFRFDERVRYENPIYTYDELSQIASSEIKPEKEVLKLLDLALDSMLDSMHDGISQDIIRSEQTASVYPFTTQLFSMLGKTRNRYLANQAFFYLLLTAVTLHMVTTSPDARSILVLISISSFEVIIQLAKSYYKDKRSFSELLELTRQAQTWRKNSTITLRNNCASHFKKKL